MKPGYLALLFPILMLPAFNASAAGSALRIACDGDAEGAEVYLNGKFKGECPLDMKVPAGKLKLRVQKVVDADHEPRRFEQEIRMGDGVVKKVEVQLSPLELNAAGKKLEEERRAETERREREKAISGIEAEMVAIPGRNYAMGKYEVTQGLWKAIMGNNPSAFDNCGDNCPVERVSWNDVQEFLRKLNSKTGRQYRLPTEAEWEYACHGGQQAKFCGGNNIDSVAWYRSNSGGETHPVGQKQANGYGLHDMSGNVWELMENCYSSSCAGRAIRGGAWDDDPQYVRAAKRLWVFPAIRFNYSGFRLARTLP